jgi:hypothetical protein
MTADPYVRDRAGRFAKLPHTLFRDCPPIPEPQRVGDDGEERGASWVAIPAPKCPHNHFARWARRFDDKGRPNCKPCHQEARRDR